MLNPLLLVDLTQLIAAVQLEYSPVLETLQAIGNSRGVDEIVITNIDNENLQHPEDLFCHLAKQPWAMWLDSCESQHCDAEYDIIVWQPSFTLTTVDDVTRVTDLSNQQAYSFTTDPLSVLDTLNNAVFTKSILPTSTLPFVGGALGYFAYDLGRRFEKLPKNAKKDINQPDMAVGIYTHAVIFHRKTSTFKLVSPKSDAATRLTSITDLLAKKAPVGRFSLTSDWQANMTKSQYQQKFAPRQAPHNDS